MELEYLKGVIVDQRKDLSHKITNEHIIRREFIDYINKYATHPNAFLISGIRRSGKSITSYLLFKNDSFVYINFDDERLFDMQAKDLNVLMEAFYALYGDVDQIILDEIQNVPGWELFVSRLRETKKVIVTGSNANLLSKEFATYLTGRYIEFTIYPFSFREYLIYKGLSLEYYETETRAKIKNALQEYISVGGFPEAILFGEKFITSLYESIITKDIVVRYRIKYIKTFKELTRLLINNFASEITFSKLAKMVDIKSVHTVKNYIGYLESAFMVFTLERFSFKLKESIRAPKKVYCIDTNLIHVISNLHSKNYGRLIENIVAIELFRRKTFELHQELFYWKDHKQFEADFVIKEKNKIIEIIQVCYDLQNLKTREREINGLLKASEALQCENLKIITMDQEEINSMNNKKINIVPLWKWLLSWQLKELKK